MPMQAVHKRPHTGVDARSGVHNVMVAVIAVAVICLMLFGLFQMYAPPRNQKLDRVEAIAHRRARMWDMADDETEKSTNAPRGSIGSRSNDLAR